MNVGMQEAAALAATLTKILRGNGSLSLLEDYQKSRRNEWEQLLGIKHSLKAGKKCKAWVKKHAARILPCLPASGDDLSHLLKQLGLDLK